MTISVSTIIWAASMILAGVGVLVGALAYFIRYLFERMMKQLDVLNNQRTECLSTLSIRFADKAETQYAIGRLDDRVRDIEGVIRRQ